MRISMRSLPALVCLILVGAAVAWASITGSIAGIVTDPSGAVIPNATVTATNTDTGVKSVVQTDGKGFYSFPDLPVGNYDVEISVAGFKSFRQTRIHIDANSAIRVDAKLEIGVVSEKVTVASDAVHVETQNTQMGEVINSQRMTSVPLNGRDFTDLLSLQPGVVPHAYAAQAPGLNDRTVSGSTEDLNAGNQSINGQREAANGFMINGANANEGKNNGTAIIPNLDSIEEFRIITNNFDAEYGNYNGGQVNVVTKSGTNAIHGNLFEFNRNTAFNTRDFFDTTGSAAKLIQNQFGGTVGGPVKRDKVFFFGDYQGTRRIFAPTQTTSVPTLADRPDTASNDGNAVLLDQFTQLIANGGTPGVVNSDVLSNPNSWANVLSSRLGYQVVPNEPYFTPSCDNTNPNLATGCVFPGGVIPHSAISPAAMGLLPFIPKPTNTDPAALLNNFSTSGAVERARDDKGSIRIDGNTRWGMLSAYYHIDDNTVTNPYPNGGATVPGFNALSDQRGQLWVLSDTKSLGSTAVNEFRFSYLRSGNHLFSPQGGLGVTLSSLGFNGSFNAQGGIGPIDPALVAVPTVTFNNFTMGEPSDTTRQFNNTFQWQDNYTKIVGRHSFKFGGQFHYDQINDRNFFGENGDFTFSGSETGVDFADFLIGAPSGFIQASEQILDSRSKYMGLYAQDSWRVTPNLTFNYGLRWEFSQPWYDTQNKIETLVPGEQSVVFPGAPTGYLVPGDPGIPKTLAPTQYHNFSPRLGLAYSPGMDSGWIAKLTGGPGKTSIRMGYGIYYTSVEDLTQFQEIGDPPYGLFYVSPNAPIFETPYIDRATGNSEGQRFPFVFPPAGASAKNPDTTFNWAGVEPISGTLLYKPSNVTPYSENYEFSLQRQFGNNTVLSVSYVGNQGHKLISEIEANLPNNALCNQLNALGATPSCGAFAEGNLFTLPPNTAFPASATPNVQTTATCASGVGVCNAVNTVYTILGPQFGNNPFEATIAQSSYNSLQASVKHTSGLATFLIGYTYSKCMDDASGLQEGLNPVNPRLSMGLCIFDVTQNFVGSYETQVPFDRMFHTHSGWTNKLASGWSISTITTFATGLPVTLSETDDGSFSGTVNTEANIDVPNFTPGKILNNTDPRKLDANGNPIPYFNTSLFSLENGQIGNSRRRFFHGPGLNNWDMALLKNTKLTESKSLQFRFEAFNIWNHAQFLNPSGNINGAFGIVSSDVGPRVLQAGLKVQF
jgi:hypothetical protein